jgi:C1A family cysteine protease
MFKAICFSAIVATGLAASPITDVKLQGQFLDFMKKHNKQYPSADVFSRFNIFKANLAKIEAHNAAGNSWTMAVNEFADLTADEFKATYYGYKHRDQSVLRELNHPEPVAEGVKFDDALDWRTKGAVTPVKNQGQCGSCWSFSTTGSVEGAHQIATGNLVSLSEQQLVDCAGSAGNQGCNGGLMDDAFTWIISNGGITTEENYPYTAADGTCNTGVNAAATISSFIDVPQGQESALTPALANGPVSIAIEADQSAFQFYSGGVMDGRCGKKLDHGVLLVGYGTDSGKDYWIVKNSWGASWGEQGYIRLIQGQDQCGLSDAASYPVV